MPKLHDRRRAGRRSAAVSEGAQQIKDDVVVLWSRRKPRFAHWMMLTGTSMGGPYSECFPY